MNEKKYGLKWVKRAGIRALKTFAETCAGFLLVGLGINEIDWVRMISVAVVAMLADILMSIKGLSEV